MKSVNITRDGIIECYGNRAGYIRNNIAVIDEMFERNEVAECLKQEHGVDVAWEKGVYDRLIHGKAEESVMLKSCRIHQLKPNVDVMMKFVGYDELIDRGFGEPDIKNYKIVYDGNIGTNNLEEIYDLLNKDRLPAEYTGYHLSKSDIIELYDESGSNFYYVDNVGFIKLDMSEMEEVQEIKPDKKQVEKQQISIPQEEQVSQRIKEEPPQPEPVEQKAFQVETFKINL